MASRRPVVYLRGYQRKGNPTPTLTWYSIDLQSFTTSSSSSIEEQQPQSLPFFELKSYKGGSWTVVGEHIYYVGGFHEIGLSGNEVGNVSRFIFKYNTASAGPSPSPSQWEQVLKPRKFILYTPAVFVLIGTKFYVLGGKTFSCLDDEFCGPWGEIYDLDSQTWKTLEIDIEQYDAKFHDYYCAVLEGDPTTILLFSFHTGRILFYHVHTDTDDEQPPVIESHPNIALFDPSVLPKGLECCDNFFLLSKAIEWSPPMVIDSTFYWLADDMHLYGYDLLDKRWFRSQCLQTDLWTPLPPGQCYYLPPILVNLRDGRFLAIAHVDPGELAMAFLQVFKCDNSLNVSVNSLHSLHVDPSFVPLDAALMLKDCRPGTMLGKRKFAVEN